MAGKKADDAEIDQRISKVYDMLVDGGSPRHIWQYVSEKLNWPISRRTFDRYILEANKQLAEASKIVREEEIGKAVNRYTKIYFKADQIQDYKTAIAAQKELSALLGLAAPGKLEITGANGQPLYQPAKELTDEQIAAELEAIQQRRSGKGKGA